MGELQFAIEEANLATQRYTVSFHEILGEEFTATEPNTVDGTAVVFDGDNQARAGSLGELELGDLSKDGHFGPRR